MCLGEYFVTKSWSINQGCWSIDHECRLIDQGCRSIDHECRSIDQVYRSIDQNGLSINQVYRSIYQNSLSISHIAPDVIQHKKQYKDLSSALLFVHAHLFYWCFSRNSSILLYTLISFSFLEKPCPSSSRTRYSTSRPFSSSLATI